MSTPQTRKCPKCNAVCPSIGLFCPKCGFSFSSVNKNINKFNKIKPPPPPIKNKPDATKENPEGKSAEKLEKHLRIRQKVAEEMLATEKSYIKHLDAVCDKYLSPLRQAIEDGRPIISAHDVQMVFSVISVLRDLNRKFLADLEPLIQNYTLETELGKTLLDFAPYFKMYTQYVNAHENDKVQAYLRKLDTTAPNSAFKTFCYDTAKAEMTLPLPALLITPVQRIPRYRLLVSEYLKHTEPSHRDYGDLERALDKIKETATIINEAVRRQQQRNTVVELETKFTSNPKFVSPSRIFKKQGPLIKKCRADDRKYEFFLFNDLMVYGRVAGKDRYTLHKRIPIDQAFNIEELPQSENQYSFQIINSVKSFVVYTESEEETREWISALKETIVERANAVDKVFAFIKYSMRGEANFIAPIWESDKKKQCQRQRKPDGSPCGTTFTILKRRHHCRQCGVLCCNDCSPYNVYLRTDSKKKERVCTACILGLMELSLNRALYKTEQLPSPSLHSSLPGTTKLSSSTSSMDAENSPVAQATQHSTQFESSSSLPHSPAEIEGHKSLPPPPPPVRPPIKNVPQIVKPKPPPGVPPRRRNMNDPELPKPMENSSWKNEWKDDSGDVKPPVPNNLPPPVPTQISNPKPPPPTQINNPKSPPSTQNSNKKPPPPPLLPNPDVFPTEIEEKDLTTSEGKAIKDALPQKNGSHRRQATDPTRPRPPIPKKMASTREINHIQTKRNHGSLRGRANGTRKQIGKLKSVQGGKLAALMAKFQNQDNAVD